MIKTILRKKLVVFPLGILFCFSVVMASNPKDGYGVSETINNKWTAMTNLLSGKAEVSTATNFTGNGFEISGTAQTRGEMSQNQFTGNAELKINGEPRSAVVSVHIVEPFTTIEGGNQIATISYRLNFENGDSITASGKLNLTVAGAGNLQSLNSALGVTESKGIFANSRGQFIAHGNMNPQTGDASWEINGTIENQGGTQ